MGNKPSKGNKRKQRNSSAQNDDKIKCDDGYLDFPRIHFYGKFRASPSTDNNVPNRYGRAMVEKFEEFQAQNLPINFDGDHDNWNPYGDGTWSFKDCAITCVYGKDGKVDEKTYNNFEINPSSNNISGRLVDLDPDQQGISRIYGFGINVCDKNNNNNILLKSKFEPSSFHNMWLRVGDISTYGKLLFPAFSSSWVTVLTQCEFADFDENKYFVLNQLKKRAQQNGNKLMIKFITDGYNDNFKSKDGQFTYGRVYGVIGVYSINNPKHSLRFCRYLAGTYPGGGGGLVGGFGGQYVAIKYNKSSKNLYVDLSNGIPTYRGENGYEEPMNVDVGDINIKLNDKVIETIKSEEYRNMDKWRINGGIYSFLNVKINEKDYYKHPIIISYSKDKIDGLNTLYRGGKPPPLGAPTYPWQCMSKEGPNGYYAMSETLQLRLGTLGEYMFGNMVDFTAVISKYGQPITTKNDASISITISASSPDVPVPTGWNQQCKKENVAINGNQINDGFFKVKIIAPDTLFDENGKLPRWNDTYYLSSFVYNLQVNFGDNKEKTTFIKNKSHHLSRDDMKQSEQAADNDDAGDEDEKKEVKLSTESTQPSSFFVGSVLVFNELEVKQLPPIVSWQPDMGSDYNKSSWQPVIDNLPSKLYVHPIFRQYANLYPIMRDIVNLDDFQDVTTKISALQRAFNAPFDSAHYMPVSRDLSGQQLMLIKSWLQNPVYCDILIDPVEIQNGFYGDIRDKDTLKQYLQCAIEIELSTLPLYLSALYSMDPNNDTNEDIISLIRGITHQEMQHMALACNLLIAIGGKPRIAYRDVLERTSYPRKGLIRSKLINVLPDVDLELAPMDTKKTMETFMNVEAPAKFKISYDDTNTFKAEFVVNDSFLQSNKENNMDKHEIFYTIYSSPTLNKVASKLIKESNEIFTGTTITYYSSNAVFKAEIKDDEDEKKNEDPDPIPVSAADHSIGGFYELVRKGFEFLNSSIDGSNLFDVNNIDQAMKKQIGPNEMKDVNYVYNLKSALSAIESIVSEGEGTSMSDIWSKGTGLSHFHKFLEIHLRKPILTVKKRNMTMENKNKFPYVYVFANDVTIPFDEEGVINDTNAWNWLKLDNKDKMNESKNDHDIRVIRFNEDYGKLLILLQDIFGEGKSEKFGAAVGLMRQLQIDFNECLRPPTSSGKTESDKDDKTLQPRIAPNWIPPDYIIKQ